MIAQLKEALHRNVIDGGGEQAVLLRAFGGLMSFGDRI
jgi:hypothetical protein